MLKMLTAYTNELDDIDVAVSEIVAQLDLDHSLLANTVGIVTCYVEYIETGVLAAVCERMPFDVIGKTTMSNGTAGEVGQMMLTLTVLTSDTIRFSTVMTESLFDTQEAPIADAYKTATAALNERPSLMIAFAPLIGHVGGELIVETVSQITGNVPLYGSIACDHNTDYHEARTIFNGQCMRNNMAFTLLEGDIGPNFYWAAIPQEKVQRQNAVITASHGNVLEAVNNMPILDYMQTLGLANDGELVGSDSIPFVIDYGDGSKPITRTIYTLTPEKYAVCGGRMPVGATLSIATIDTEDVLTTARQVIGDILASPKRTGLLMFPCVSRNLVLGADAEAELDLVRDLIGGQIPYLFAYSGGEFCPTYLPDGSTVNQFHNHSFIACAF